jgi:hypothetical protein
MKTFRQFITESQESLDKIGSAWRRKYPGMKFHSTLSNSGDVRLHAIEVPKEKRNQGIGSRAIKGLTRYADKQNKRVTLTPQADKGKKGKLEKFYKSFGFNKNSGRNKDFSVSDSRIRNPKLSEELIMELFGQVQRIQKQIKNTTDKNTKKALRDKLKRVRERDRKIKSVTRKANRVLTKQSRNSGRRIARSKPVRKAKDFLVKTTLGALLPF